MQRIVMLRTVEAYPDGITRTVYAAGQVYAVDDQMVRNFIEMGACELVLDKAIKAAPERKARAKVQP